MEYHFVPTANYQDFASGRVIRSRPGMPAFPVRLASELFLRAASTLQKAGHAPPYHLYDPVCGGGFSLTALGFLHRPLLRRLSASDIDRATIDLAASNLALLTADGLEQRWHALTQLAASHARQSHADALESIARLHKTMPSPFPASAIHAFAANALDAASMQLGIGAENADIMFADVPYGHATHWLGADAVSSSEAPLATRLLTAAAALQAVPKIIILATSKQERPAHPRFHRLKMLQNGKRRISIFAPVSSPIAEE